MLRVAPLLALLSLALPLSAQTKVAFSSLGAKVVGLRFFPSEEGFPPVAERFFRPTYDSATSKYINLELELAYPAATAPVEVSLTCRYEGPGGMSATPAFNAKIQSGWTASYHVGGWGAKTRGTWAVGTYNVACRDGATVVASGSFEVTRAAYDIPAIKGVVTGLRFFEGPKETPELKSRRYSQTFSNGATRRVYIELGVDYPSTASPATFPFECRYDFPDSRSFQLTINGRAEAGWTGSYHVGNVGFEATGMWVVGKYQVSCRFEGRVVASGGFRIE